MEKIKAIANVCIIIACYFFVYALYMGLLHRYPGPGDSWDYHMPIERSILNGSFLHLTHAKRLWYYPGASEAINSLFLSVNLLTLSNIFAAIVLFFFCFKLARTFRLSSYYSLLFALAFITTNVVLRWLNAVSIDVWVGVFFVWILILLENPKKSLLYFATLGFTVGMLIGSKYSALYFLVILLLFYGKKLFQCVSPLRFLAFFIPFSVFGLFWYIRNFLLTKNPFYPVQTFGFHGPFTFTDTMLHEAMKHPVAMFNAGFGEYHLWLFSILIALALVVFAFVITKDFSLGSKEKLSLIGILNFSCFLFFPTDAHPWIMVSSFRYSLPIFIPLMLSVFLFASKYKHEELLGYIVVGNMIVVLTMGYYPKLMLVSLPVSLLFIYLFTVKTKRLKQ